MDEKELFHAIEKVVVDGYEIPFVGLSEDIAKAVMSIVSPPAEVEVRTVNTVEELDKLPHYALVVDRHGDAWQYRGGLWCSHETARFGSERLLTKYSPLTLVWVPATPGEGKEQ